MGSSPGSPLGGADGLQAGGAAGDSPTPSSRGQPAPAPPQHHQRSPTPSSPSQPVAERTCFPSPPCLPALWGRMSYAPTKSETSHTHQGLPAPSSGWPPRSVKLHREAPQCAPLEGCRRCQRLAVESRLLWSSGKRLRVVHAFLHRNSCLLLMQFGRAWLEEPTICWPAGQMGSSLSTARHL